MQQSGESQKFSFGEVVDTEYVPYQIVDTENTLPYNPFLFQYKLIIYKSKPNYEEPNTQYLLSQGKKTIFGRKKKHQKQWTDEQSTPIYLNAEIISEKHFSISQRYLLKDQNSKHGTYLWVSRTKPQRIETNDVFLIAKQPLTIVKVVHLPKPSIQLLYKGKSIKLNDNKKLFLIGSHQKCDLIIPSLFHFQVCINLSSFKIFAYLDQQQACSEHGLWYRLRNDKPSGIQLQNGNLILVQPYIFKITS